MAYSSGRRPEALHDTSADSDAVASRVQPQPGPSQQVAGPSKNINYLFLSLALFSWVNPQASNKHIDRFIIAHNLHPILCRSVR